MVHGAAGGGGGDSSTQRAHLKPCGMDTYGRSVSVMDRASVGARLAAGVLVVVSSDTHMPPLTLQVTCVRR